MSRRRLVCPRVAKVGLAAKERGRGGGWGGGGRGRMGAQGDARQKRRFGEGVCMISGGCVCGTSANAQMDGACAPTPYVHTDRAGYCT